MSTDPTATAATFRARFITTISLTVDVEATDEEEAADLAWDYADGYLQTLNGDGRHVVSVEASVDGIGADEVVQQ